MAKETRQLEVVNLRLSAIVGSMKPAHSGDAIGRNAHPPGVFLDGCFVRGEVYAVHLVAGYVAMEPLDLGAHCLAEH
jgi:hypothetical protein